MYKIYYKNDLRGNSNTTNATNNRFQQYDRKSYKTKAEAERKLAEYKKKFTSVNKSMKKQGIKETYEIRSAPKTKRTYTKQNSGFGGLGGFKFKFGF